MVKPDDPEPKNLDKPRNAHQSTEISAGDSDEGNS